MSTAPRFRFAPSPTGSFHVGGARTALHNWALARRLGGTFVLRIEDTDEARNRPEWTQGIIDALAWIGISTHDEHFEGPHFQSEHAQAHVEAAQRLYESGAAYYCDLTGQEVQDRAKELDITGYDGYSRDRGLEPGPGRVLRFRVPDGHTIVRDAVRGDVDFDNSTIEDFVLLRGNGTPMFLLANVVDDIEMAITDVVRAEEHLPNTPKQQMLWEALGQEPPRWAHVPVLVNEQRKKLSKRRDKVALESYRDDGILADAMVNYLMTLGWTPPRSEELGSEIFPWSELEAEFRLEDVTLSPAFFDVKKLVAFNKQYIKNMPVDEFLAEVDAELPSDWDRERFAAIAPHIMERLERLGDAPGLVDFLFLPDGTDPEMDEVSWDKATKPEWSAGLLSDLIAEYRGLDAEQWQTDVLKATIEDVMERYEIKLGKAQALPRVAVTGRAVGPPLFEALEVLGQDETVRRLELAATRLQADLAPD
ncbi:glutamate--tRNA ligase [Ilumatobacter nonamiensis]|uniref:glutamate--tRNA ligase n=1 Tax=Ilumatobacter nonamiensis TaxID=467093 RepID=UPI00058B37CF|nr:glutamate--tRNA ligase [Ilumatobacter nonamiensis]